MVNKIKIMKITFTFLFFFILFNNCSNSKSQIDVYVDETNQLQNTELHDIIGLFNYKDLKHDNEDLVTFLFRKFNSDSLMDKIEFNCFVHLIDRYYESPNCYIKKFDVTPQDPKKKKARECNSLCSISWLYQRR